MSEAEYLFVLPVIISLGLVPLRRRRPAYWWLALLALIALTIVISVANDGSPLDLWQSVLLVAAPLTLMFAALRADLFRRRPYLILIVGPGLYLIGVGLSLALGVATGLMNP